LLWFSWFDVTSVGMVLWLDAAAQLNSMLCAPNSVAARSAST
jgi:hypothetical protein